MQIKDVLFHWIPQARQTVTRFPLTVLNAVLCAILMTYLAHQRNQSNDELSVKLMMLSLGIALFTAIALLPFNRLSEKLKVSPRNLKFGANILGVVMVATLVAIYGEQKYNEIMIKFLALGLMFHLAVAIAPFIGSKKHDTTQLAFWKFNQALFARAILTGAYTLLLFGGISIAIWSLDPLFGIRFESEAYGTLFAWVGFVVSVLFFLSAVPEDPEALEAGNYPSDLRILVPNVALPLIAIYLVILYVYAAKILITRNWPEGKIGWLISSLSFVVILASLLVYPIGEDPQRPFVRWLNKNVYRFLLPLMAILFLAVFERVDAYGWTEPRYVLLALGIWTTLIAALSIGRKRLSIFWIPTTLLLVTLIATYGPINMFNVSLRSQTHRVQTLLQASGYKADGKSGTFEKSFDEFKKKALASSLVFVCKRGGAPALKELLNVDYKQEADDFERRYDNCDYDRGQVARAMKAAGTTYPNYAYDTNEKEKSFRVRFYGNSRQTVALPNANGSFTPFNFYDVNPKRGQRQLFIDEPSGSFDPKTKILTVETTTGQKAEADLSEFLETLKTAEGTNGTSYDDGLKTSPKAFAARDGVIIVTDVGILAYQDADEIEITSIQGYLILKK